LAALRGIQFESNILLPKIYKWPYSLIGKYVIGVKIEKGVVFHPEAGANVAKKTLFLGGLGMLLPVFFIVVGPLSADEIVLENGNILTGTIVKVEGGTLTLKTDYSKPIEIQSNKIKKIESDQPVEIHLISGEVLKGKIKTVEAGKIAVEESAGQTPVNIEWPKVASLNVPPKAPPKWKGSITVGGSQQTGNTETKAASVAAEAIRKTEKNRFTFRFLWNYAQEKDDITARNAYGLLKYDRFFTKRFFGYLAVEGYNDRFKDWRLRYVIGPGVGYQIWDDAVKSLSVEGGVGYSYEDLYEGQNRDYMSARLAADFKYTLAKFIVFGDHFVIYPNLDYGGEYTLRNEASLLSPLGAGWALKLSNIYERNSDPAPDVLKDDVAWILGLQYSF
jgi:putative salt-induced outer membrane protein YdiY/sRNA-binding regulator protein Hfq